MDPNESRGDVFAKRLLVVLFNPWFLAAATAIVLGAVSLSYAGPVDEAIWGYCSWLWAVHGEPPYSASIENKPAGILLLHRACYAIFGQSLLPVRMLGLVATVATMLLVYAASRRYQGKIAGAMSALFFGLASASPATDGNTLGFTETFMDFFSATAFFLLSMVYWRGPQRRVWPYMLGVGAALGTALTFKQVALVDLIGLIPMYWVARGHNAPIARILGDVLLMAVAGGVLTVLSILPFLASGTTLGEYVYAAWVILWYQAGQIPVLRRLRLFTSIWTNGPLVTFYPLVLLYLFQKDRLRDAGVPFGSLLFWLVLDFAAANTSNMFPHQVKPLLVPLSMIGGIGVGVFVQALDHCRPKWLLWMYLSSVLLLFPANSIVVGIARSAHLSRNVSADMREQRAYRLAVDYVRSHTDPSDCVYIWAFHSHVIHIYSERRSPCRYFNLIHCFMPDFEVATVADLAARPPKLILIEDSLETQEDQWEHEASSPPAYIWRLLAQDYVPTCRIADRLQVFRRLPPENGSISVRSH